MPFYPCSKISLFNPFKTIKYQVVRTVPLNTLLMLILHHTPSSPKKVEDSIKAAGIRRALKVTLTKDGGTVLPKPLKAPDLLFLWS